MQAREQPFSVIAFDITKNYIQFDYHSDAPNRLKSSGNSQRRRAKARSGIVLGISSAISAVIRGI